MTRALALLAVSLFSSCDPRGSTVPAQPGGVPSNLVLRSYEVPNGAAQRLRSVLRELLWFGSEGKDSNKYVGRADVGPDGRLIVLAPESVHEGVKTLVASVTANPLKEPGTVRLSYWVVVGTPGKSEVPLAPGLAEVAPALAELEKNDGPMSFTLVEKLQLGSLNGERGQLQGRDTNVRQFTSVVEGQLTADITLERMAQKMETRVRLEPGQIVVLASSGAPTRDQTDSGRAVYFLMRAAPNDGAGR
ncbi:MAG: hypothetical protein Q8L48_39420 [Archangium sp.]|nr:hypothetical protein [Archangium sp.]